MFRKREPDPPVNIVLHTRDGRRIPVDSMYVGKVRGEHWWVVPRLAGEDIASFSVDKLPARTAIRFEVLTPEGPDHA